MLRAFALALPVLPACAAGPSASPRCENTTVTVDPVRGDVNTSFVTATVRIDGEPAAGETVGFELVDGTGPLWALPTAVTGDDGVAVADLGVAVLEEAMAAAVARAATVDAYLSRRRGADSCVLRGSAEFAPAVRSVQPPRTVARTAAELRRALREFITAAEGATGAPRLADGASACRLLHAVAADAALHPDWLGPTPRRTLDTLRAATASCITSPAATAQVVARALS